MAEKTLPNLKSLDGYELLEVAGRGGMGVVYRAWQNSLQRPVAVKVLHLHAAEESPVKMLERESQTMATLNHPNIVTIFDFHHFASQAYLVMEWVDGATLRSLIVTKRPLRLHSARKILAGAAAGLAYIHERGILHLDFKPENVMVAPQGTVKITDFGLSLNVPVQDVADEFATTAGTLDYCAPEQKHGLRVDVRSDVFSFAAVAYEMLTGYVPGRAYVPASSRNPSLSKQVDRVLKKGLSREPEFRHENVTAFHEDLAAALGTTKRWLSAPVQWALTMFVFAVALLLIYAQRLEPVGRPVRPGNWLVFDADESPPTGVGANVSPAPVIPPTLPEKVPLPVDALPVPLPAQVVGFEGGVGTFHPMLNADVLNAEQLAILQSSARIQVRKGGCVRAGDFSGDCLSLSPGRGPWQYYAHAQAEGVSVEVGDDSTGNQVLQISCDAEAAGKEISTGYQWLHVAPFEEGERMVLRFRARLVHGQVSFALAPSLPLRIASNDESELAKWLIESSRPAPFPPDGDGVQRWLQIKDWFTPSSDWTSFFVAFDWPPFCTIAKHRNLELYVRGRGEIWIDDVQLSPLKELAFAAETKEPSNSDDGRAR